jgi:hypothetical protein
VLSRIGELGVFVKDGALHFNPRLLRDSEFIKDRKTFHYTTINKVAEAINLEKNSLCFTYCQVLVIYKKVGEKSLKVFFTDGAVSELKNWSLDVKTSKQIFERSGIVAKIEVSI